MTLINNTEQTFWSGSALKWLAIITMLIDHIGAVVIENGILYAWDSRRLYRILETDWGRVWYQIDMVFRTIGRISFPIFCFLLVEGFLHTSNVKRYFLRLMSFAVISEIPFDLAVKNQVFDWSYQNIFFTLAIALLVLMGLKKYREMPAYCFAVILAGCAGAKILKTDYDVYGVLLICTVYLLREKPLYRFAVLLLLLLYESRYSFGASTLALVPISKYNRKKGKTKLKYAFYCFYPVHLLFLFLVRFLLLGIPLMQ